MGVGWVVFWVGFVVCVVFWGLLGCGSLVLYVGKVVGAWFGGV
jgi:hypothetical protein